MTEAPQPEPFATMPSGLRLTDILSVEWSPGLTEAPARAEHINVGDQPVIRLITAPGQGWVRLHLRADPDEAPILAARFVIAADNGQRRTTLTPFAVTTNRSNDRRKEIPTAPASKLELATGKFHDLTGAVICPPGNDRWRTDFVINLPRGATIDIAEAGVHWFGQAHAKPVDEVKTLTEFAAHEVPDLAEWLALPPVFGQKLDLTEDRLSGWVLTGAHQMFWSDDASGRRGEAAAAVSWPLAAGVEAPCGIDHVFDPSLGSDAVLRLALTERGAPRPIWIGSPTAGGPRAKPAADLIDITETELKDFRLRVRGHAIHPRYPGLPVRLELNCGAETIASAMAFSRELSTQLPNARSAYAFDIDAPLRPGQTDGPFSVALRDDDKISRLFFWPTVPEPQAAPLGPQAQTVTMMPPGGSVEGSVDAVSEAEVTGWAACPEAPDMAVELLLSVDDVPFSVTQTRSYRKDVQNRYGNRGENGFRFELPPNMAPLGGQRISVTPLTGTGTLRRAEHLVPQPAGDAAAALSSAQRQFTPHSRIDGLDRISVIVLNRNGATLLEDMFTSCAPEDLSDRIEWIVVDHASTDNSQEVCQRFAGQGADIRFLPRRGNFSFSESNNFGARHASGDILLFANNDLVFSEAFGDRLRGHMSVANVGVLGARLLDHVEEPARSKVQAVQHDGVFIGSRVSEDGWVRPYEARAGAETATGTDAALTRAVAVTGAFMALRRADFDAVGGFDEGYAYGLEDADLCLKVASVLQLDVVCARDIQVVHHRGYSRGRDKNAALRRAANNALFTGKWGYRLRRTVKRRGLSDPAVITGTRPVFAFLLAGADTVDKTPQAGIARAMGHALQQVLPCHIRFVPQDGWMDLAGVDVAIVMAEGFDLRAVERVSPWLVTVNWMHRDFDRWSTDPSTIAYDHLFAASPNAAQAMAEILERQVDSLPAATEYDRFAQATPRADRASDYCFVGDRTSPPRALEFQLDPRRISGKGRIFGGNWQHSDLAPLCADLATPSDIPAIFASSRIVLDDADAGADAGQNPWGICNAQVFDAMAAGALVVSNAKQACQALFGDLVPTFSDAKSLGETLNTWLGQEDARARRVEQLQHEVRAHHTYADRARTLLASLSREPAIRVAIKVPAPQRHAESWGDYHFAQSLAAALRRQGFVVRLDFREQWYGGICDSDDVTITLRGLVRYVPKPHQRNLLWLISHPDDVSLSELSAFDRVFVASEFHTGILQQLLPGRIEFLPQCTDVARFAFDPEAVNTQPDRSLYVANSRGVFRDPARWAMSNDLDLDIHGGGWEAFITDDRLKGGVVPNSVLGSIYASSRLVVCDHWQDMKDLGYVSNRVFDVLAAGGRLVVDAVRGLDGLVPAEFYDCFQDEQDFVRIIKSRDTGDLSRRQAVAEWVAEHHSFDARAVTFAEMIRQKCREDQADTR